MVHLSYGYIRALLLIFILINAIFLLSMPLLPFIDLPNHLAEATIYKYYNAPGNVISDYYRPTPWYFPNTFHTVFCSFFPTVQVGNAVFHILYIILLQASLYLVIKQLGGNPWYGLLGILVTYNYNVSFGFVGYAISIPTIIILFYFTLKDMQEEKLSVKITIALLLVLLFFMHAQNALFGLLLYGLMMVYHHGWSLKKLIARGVLTSLPLVIFIVAWWFTREGDEEGSTGSYLLKYYTSDYFQNFLIRFRIIVFDNFQLREGLPGLIIAALFFGCILFPVLYFRPWRNRSRKDFFSRQEVHALIFFLISFACYLFLPDKLPGQSPLSQRFCSIAILSFIIFASITLNKVTSGTLRYFVLATVMCYTVLWFEYIYAFNRENRGFNEAFFNGTENHDRLAGLIYEHAYRGRKVYIHYPNYFVVWKRGIATSKIIDYRFGVVRRVAAESELPFYHELIGERYKRVPTYAGLDLILVRGKAPVNSDVNLSNFTLLRKSGRWQLYKRKG